MTDDQPRRRGPGRPPGLTGIPLNLKRTCGNCGERKERAELTEKVVQFRPLINRNKVIRARTIVWLCDPCRDMDADYLRPARRRTSLEVAQANGTAT